MKTILIVEDEMDILLSLETILESENFKVLIAKDGLEALEVLNNHKMPNLILLDMKMPRMNGWEFAAAFKENFKTRSPILVMTAAADAQQRAKDINATDWIEKPFNLDNLLEKIQKCISRIA